MRPLASHPIATSPQSMMGRLPLTTASSRVITWAVSSGATNGALNVSGDNLSCSVIWSDQPNAPVDKIKVSVKYSKTNQTDVVKTDEKTVTVKFIANITQMSINGSGINNGSSVDCGVQSLTISVPTPTTNPSSGITYTWSLPSGWSGSSTTNTINVTTSAGSGGNISVDARRNDVGCNQKSLVTSITRPVVGTPTLVGVPTASLCTNDFAAMDCNAANAFNFTWSVTGPFNIPFATSNSAVVVPTGRGSGTVTAIANNNCLIPQSVTRDIFAGSPVITNATVDGQQLATPNYIYNPALLNITPNNEVGTSYDWQILQGSGNIYYNGYNQVSAYAYPFVRIQATVSNQCGAGDTRTFYLYDQSNGFYRMASPNPATNSIITDIILMEALKKVTLVSDARPGIVRMYNANGSLNADTHRHNNLLSFDVDNLPRGLYHLNFVFEGNRTFTENIVLN